MWRSPRSPKASRSANAGKLTVPVVRELVSDIILVDEPLLERAVNAYLTLQKTMAEGAGAAGLAAMLEAAGAVPWPQSRSNPVRRQYRSAHSRLDHGARTGTCRPHRVVPPDHSGPSQEFWAESRAGSANSAPIFLSVDHHRLFLDVPAKGAKLDVTMETRGRAHAEEIFSVLREEGYHPVLIESGAALE